PAFAFDEKLVLSSSGLLAMTELPRTLIVLGAGAIGCEFAYVMNAFGVKVTLIELGEHVLPSEDLEVAQVLDASFRNAGINVYTKTRAISWKSADGGVVVDVETDGKIESIKADKVLAAFGRTPNTDGIGLEL